MSREQSADRRTPPPSDQFSLALGRAVAQHLLADGTRVRAVGRRNLTRARAQHSLQPSWIRRWQELLDGPEDMLIEALTSPAEDARVLRQSSPFAGVLTPQERWALLREVREARRAARSA